jgi:hypothetical protein
VTNPPRFRDELLLLRAHDRCEYCHIPVTRYSYLGPQIEHIVARQHGGGDNEANLAVACKRCNLLKGPNLTAIDPATGEIIRLFHPRRDDWHEHFAVVSARIKGRTSVGRTTATLLRFNDPKMCRLRRALLRLGVRFE